MKQCHYVFCIEVDWYRIYMGSSVDQFVEGTDNLKLIVEREGLSPGELVTIPNYDMQQSATAFFAVESVFRNQPVNIFILLMLTE